LEYSKLLSVGHRQENLICKGDGMGKTLMTEGDRNKRNIKTGRREDS